MARVCVEGNIGCGKSTALSLLAARRPDVAVFQEPVEEWEPLLGLHYADPATWALPFSLKVLLAYARPAAGAPAVVERSPLSCRHVFAQLLFNEGKMRQEEWELYKEYCDVLGWQPDVVVYIHTPADECHRRVEQRGRPSERGIDLQYLKRLEFKYETMLRYADVPVVIRLDGTQPPDLLAQELERIVNTAFGTAAAPA